MNDTSIELHTVDSIVSVVNDNHRKFKKYSNLLLRLLLKREHATFAYRLPEAPSIMHVDERFIYAG